MNSMITINHNTSLLSRREIEIVNLLSQEYSTKDIANELFIGFETVKTHRRNIQIKLDAKNIAGVIRMAFQKRILIVE